MINKFLIVTHVNHITSNEGFYAYPPYIREMNLWLGHVDEVEIVAPANLHQMENHLSYQHSQLKFIQIPSFDFLSFASAVKAILQIPISIYKITSAMKRSDHFHLRCPGNIGLLGCFVQIFFPHKPKTAKYAGNWDPEAKQPWSYKLQKWILSNTFLTRKMTVLVYGDWPNQSKNILPFFTASFSESEIERTEKNFSSPYKFLFVGNLVPGKQPLFAVELVKALNAKNINAELHVYGDGEMMDALKEEEGNKAYIHLHGNQPLDVLKQAYKETHFLVLASKSEGWPKAVAEAMFFGCIPIVSNVSCLSWMLKAPPAPEGGAPRVTVTERGILIPEVRVERGNPSETVRAGWKEDSQHGLEKVVRGQRSEDRVKEESGLLDTFQKNRQFECLPDSPEGERGNVSRTGFSETLEVTSGRNKEREKVGSGRRSVDSGAVLNETVDRIIELIHNPEEMKRMCDEAQAWSQQYTLERFEAAIKDILKG